eukprot:gene15579-17153_t
MNEEGRAKSKYAHVSCNAEFRNNCERVRKQYGTLAEADDAEMTEESDISLSPVKKRTRSNTRYLQAKFRCFVYDTERKVDGNPYNEGGLGRCSIESIAQKLLERMEKYLIISHSSTLKMRLIQGFGDKIAFFPSGRYLLVHSTDVNPCEYAVAALHGCGLRDDDLVKSFGRMIRRKLAQRESQEKKWPLTSEELIEQMDKGPLPELFNAEEKISTDMSLHHLLTREERFGLFPVTGRVF